VHKFRKRKKETQQIIKKNKKKIKTSEQRRQQWRRNEFKSGETHVQREAPKIFFGRALHFLALKTAISRFGERFRDGQYSLVSFLFAVLILTVPPVPYGVGVTGHQLNTFLFQRYIRCQPLSLPYCSRLLTPQEKSSTG